MGYKTKKVVVFLDPREEELINKLSESLGGGASQVIKYSLKFCFQKMFPGYRTTILKPKEIKEEAPKLTPEQQCEALGGTVVTNEYGAKICQIITYKSKAGQESVDIKLEEDALRAYSKRKK